MARCKNLRIVLDLYTLGLNNKTEAGVEGKRFYSVFSSFFLPWQKYMKKKLIKKVEEKLYEGKVILQYLKDTGAPEAVLEEQENGIAENIKFLEYLKK